MGGRCWGISCSDCPFKKDDIRNNDKLKYGDCALGDSTYIVCYTKAQKMLAEYLTEEILLGGSND